MSGLQPEARRAIQQFVENYQDEHNTVDILRVIQEETNLLKETEEVRDAISSDPYENLAGISSKALKRFKDTLRVTVCDRQRCGADFARIHAIVTVGASIAGGNAELHLTYERKPQRSAPPNEKGCHPCSVSYSIELGYDHAERQRLLEVTVWAASNTPSVKPAICIQDQWDDIDDDEEVENVKQVVDSPNEVQLKKKQRTHSAADVIARDDAGHAETSDDDKSASHKSDRDEYLAFLDPDVMQSFLESAGLQPLDDGTAFFLLMTLPFFEHEWDIVGLVLDQIFGGESDDEE